MGASSEKEIRLVSRMISWELGLRMGFWAKSSESGFRSGSRLISWVLGCGIYGKESSRVNMSVATNKSDRWLEFT